MEATATDSPQKVEFMAVAIPDASSSDFWAASIPGRPTAANDIMRPYTVPRSPMRVATLPVTAR